MKRLITLFLFCLMTFSLTGCTQAEASYTVAYGGEVYSYEDVPELQELINAQIDVMNAAHDMAEAARRMGYSEDNGLIVTAKNIYVTAQEEMTNIKLVIIDLQNQFDADFAEKEKEYPAATKVWKFLKEKGYSDRVCAGIMGNLMAEVGGQTLALNPYASNGKYYGMCQWNSAYIEVWGADLMTQCKFLDKTMKYEFDTYGRKYKSNFDFEAFKNLNDEKDAALAFAKCYERCGSGSYKVRQRNAEVAYEYFVG